MQCGTALLLPGGMRPHLTADQREQVLAYVGTVPTACRVLELRGPSGADGKRSAALSLEQREQLIADARAGKLVEIEVDLLAFEQGAQDAKGKRIPNRKGMRLREGALQKIARSGVGTPFMRDHESGVLAKGGEVIASELERGENGYFAIRQTVKLTEPTAVERAARGLLTAVSIRANKTPGAVVKCTAHNAPIWSKCACMPLDTVTVDGEEQIAEFEFSDGELLETSEVAIGAVQNAGPSSPIRAAFAFLQCGTTNNVGTEALQMKRITDLLKLAADADENAIAEAIADLLKAHAAVVADLAVVEQREAAQAVELAAFRLAKKATDRSMFLDGLVKEGKISERERDTFGDLFDADETKARARAAKLSANSATPVGAKPISIETAAGEPAAEAGPKFEFSKDGKTLLANAGETRDEYQVRLAAAKAAGKVK